MAPNTVISWLFTILLAILGFCIVWFGLPWLLGLAGLSWPSPIILLLACLVALLILGGRYWWPRAAV